MASSIEANAVRWEIRQGGLPEYQQVSTLGATWIDKSYIQQFMYETLNTPGYLRDRITVNYSKFTAEWGITNKKVVPYNDVAAYTTYGTDRANAYRILEDSLNLRDIRIYDTVEDGECVILFLRKCSDESKPFYTVEVRGQKAVQVQGVRNCGMTPEVETFIADWEKRVLSTQLPAAAA